MVKKNRREAMLSRPNSKVVCVDTKEGEMLYELLLRTESAFRLIRGKAGAENGLTLEDADKIVNAFHSSLFKMSDMLAIIAENADIQYREPMLITRIRKEKE